MFSPTLHFFGIIAPVAQWTEQGTPKAEMWVRFPPGALKIFPYFLLYCFKLITLAITNGL